MQPGAPQRPAETRARLDSRLSRLHALAERCRRKSLSVVVPMGEEMSCRCQQTPIAERQHALRVRRDRLPLAK